MKRNTIYLSVIIAVLCSIPVYAQQKSVTIENIPHVRQKPDFCGEACAEMVLKKNGHKGTQDWVFDNSGLSPMLGRGCYTADLARALKEIGFDIGKVWYFVRDDNSDKGLRRLWENIYNDLNGCLMDDLALRLPSFLY